jgi:hypothetical protein
MVGVIMMGGEYNGGSPVWTSLGAIYDPIADTWTPVSPPNGPGWINTISGSGRCNGGIGDAASIVLPNGTFMLSAACANPPVNALFNPTTLGWTITGTPSKVQGEQGYTLLPNGKVLPIDVPDPPNVQQYDPTTGTWTYIGSTPMSLVDPCGHNEIGPAVTRPDGTVVAFGGNTGCSGSADPTAVYNSSNNTWTQGPNVPATCGTDGTTSCTCTLADAAAALLPNGNILFASSAGLFTPPTHFFEFTTTNTIEQVADESDGCCVPSSRYNFLVLPNGQILVAKMPPPETFGGPYNLAIYTPTGSANAAWAPTITSVSSCVAPGSSYVLSGTQLNGLSQGAAYGDDVQGATNYPLVQIINNGTGHVFYARTSGHSTMSIAPGQVGSTSFIVASATETGASTLYVIANGIPSAGHAVTVSSSCPPTLQVSPSTDIAGSGPQGGPFSPSSFSYTLSASNGSVNYSISGIPSWLTASSTSGTASSGTTVTFTVNSSANSLAPNTASRAD